MKPLVKVLLSFLLVFAITTSCNKQDDPLPQDEVTTGILKLDIALIIEESPAGRLADVSTDDFVVKIYKVGESSPTLTFNPWSSAPAEIELETGEYYVEAQNIDPPAAAEFEQPWYYGVSENFTIDKEELKTITVNCTLANYKVAFVYSQNVLDDFTTWNSKATRNVSGEFLEWPKDDDREGYFLVGEPLSIEVHLEYHKEFDEGVISRDFFATIDDPQPATLYRVNIDAELRDGKIQIVINVDDGFDIVDINPIASLTFTGPGTIDDIEGGAEVAADPNNPEQGFGKGTTIWDISEVWLANDKTVLWGPAPNEIKASMDDAIFGDGDPNEVMDFDAGQSDLANGMLVFTGTTRVNLPSGSTAVELRFELEVFDNISQTPRALTDPADLGLPPSIGGLVELTSISDEIEARFRLLAKYPADPNFISYLDFFDGASTPEGALAYSSFTAGFYWSNLDK